MKQIDVIDLGLIPYREAWSLQAGAQRHIIEEKLAERHGLTIGTRDNEIFFLVEHPHVYTLGKSGNRENLLKDAGELTRLKAEFVPIDRGGDITYHGPGQIVGYPILDLEQYDLGIREYIHAIEEVIIRACSDYGIRAGRIDGLTGVWAGEDKICAIGVKCSRYVTMHGFAFNVATDLSYFDHIVPCGITDKGVTSLEQLLKRPVNIDEVKECVLSHFSDIFGVSTVAVKQWADFDEAVDRFKA